MTTSHWHRQHIFKSSDLSADVLIVGGGYLGLSTAYWLTEMRPDLKIIVLERNQIGAGASGRNAGFLTKGSAAFYRTLVKTWGAERALELYKFAEESLELVYQRILRASPEIKFEKTTSLTLFDDETLTSQWQQEGLDLTPFKFNWISQDGLPEPLGKNFVGAYENAPEYKINPLQLLASLRKTLESRKVQIVEGAGAFEIRQDLVLTEIHQIKARQVVLALNGYLPEFHPAFKELIHPYRAQMLAVEIPAGLNCPSLHYDPADRVYWRKAQENLLLIGGKRLLDESGEAGNFEKVSAIIQKGLEEYLNKKLELQYKVIHRWSGIMGFTEHELPMVTRCDGPMETFVIGGFSGHGMGLGFHSAKEMAELVSGKKDESYFSQLKRIKISL